LKGDIAMLIPGQYATCIANMRFREFYRMGGVPFIIQAVILKLIARNQLSGTTITLPDLVENNITDEKELDAAVLEKLKKIEAAIGAHEKLFYVKDKNTTSTENTSLSGGGYMLIDGTIIGFYSYIRTQNIKQPSIVLERESFVCVSVEGKKIISTSNFSIGLDPPPEIDSVTFKGAAHTDILSRHKTRISGRNLTRFDPRYKNAIMEVINMSSLYSAEDKVKRGVYKRVGAKLY
jgi:hypothetical protein